MNDQSAIGHGGRQCSGNTEWVNDHVRYEGGIFKLRTIPDGIWVAIEFCPKCPTKLEPDPEPLPVPEGCVSVEIENFCGPRIRVRNERDVIWEMGGPSMNSLIEAWRSGALAEIERACGQMSEPSEAARRAGKNLRDELATANFDLSEFVWETDKHIQSAIDSETSRLRAENEKLRVRVAKLGTAKELLADAEQDGETLGERERCKQYLAELLAPGPVPVSEVLAAAKIEARQIRNERAVVPGVADEGDQPRDSS